MQPKPLPDAGKVTGRLPRGVKLSRSSRRYRAVLAELENGTKVERPLGTFDTPEEAHAAWLAAARQQRGQFFRSE